MIGLADCNNFYASCEKIFNPAIRNKPVVVLSNNDGCVVARSAEAKALGIKMGVPLFEIRELVEKQTVLVYSSNYTLYGDISHRVMNTISSIVPEVENYSIDEAFLDLTTYPISQLEQIGFQIRNTVYQWTGITMSIGIAPTKVLAKVANKMAKKTNGVVVLTDAISIEKAISVFPVEDLWGIGRRYAERLHRMGVKTASQLSKLPDEWLQKNMTVNGLRIALELRGLSCIPVELFKEDRKAIGSAKSFGKPVNTLQELSEALSCYTSSCAEKLRRQQSSASILTVFIQTNFFNKTDRQYSASRTLTISNATNLTPVLLKYANLALREIFQPGYKFKRVGILLTGFAPESIQQRDLFQTKDLTKTHAVQRAIDALNLKFSRDQVRFACQGFEKRWVMKQEKLSQCFTTDINEILIVHV